MESVILLAFPVLPVINPFTIKGAGSPYTTKRCLPDWSSQDPQNLSETLNCQIKNNFLDFEQLRDECNNLPGLEEYLCLNCYRLDLTDQPLITSMRFKLVE